MSGAVVIDMQLSGARIGRVRVMTRRPQASDLFVGRDRREVALLIPRLFSVCAAAQGQALRAAVACALGGPPADHRADPVAAEAAREQLLTLLPPAGLAPFASVFTTLPDPEAFRAKMEAEFLGCDAASWLQTATLDGLADWARSGAGALAGECARRLAAAEPVSSTSTLLAPFSAADSLRHWGRLTDAMCRAPEWREGPAETGAIARTAPTRALLGALGGRPLLQRWVARLTELLAYATRGEASRCGFVSSARVADDTGRAVVETARGALMHEVTLRGDRVERYAIVAPTEWNFHPAGPMRTWLEGVEVTGVEAALGLAKAVAAALDPCVECRFEVTADR